MATITFTGQLLDPKGAALGNAEVLFLAVRTSPTVVEGVNATFSTASDGTYSVTVEHGRYDILVRAQGYRSHTRIAKQVLLDGNTVETELNDLVMTNQAEWDLTPEIVVEFRNLRDAVQADRDYIDGRVTYVDGEVTFVDVRATDADNSAVAASASATAASLSETNAAASEAAASTSETNAAASEAAASTSEGNASASATAASASESAAASSEAASAASESAAATSETNAAASEAAASASESAASTSEANASASESAAATSEANADTSETWAEKWAQEPYNTAVKTGQFSSLHHATVADNHRAAALQSATDASNAQSGAETAETNAAASEAAAASSESAASLSESNAASSEAAASSSESNAAASESLANQWAEAPEDLEVTPGSYSSYHWAQKAQALATGQLTYLGTWDASTGSYPSSPAPETGHFYKVGVAGTVNTVDYKVGDSIIFNGTDWDHIDNTESVTSVAGYLGAVTAAQLLAAMKTVDGTGSGLDADTVDGIQGSQLLRSDVSGVIDGSLTLTGDRFIKFGPGTSDNDDAHIEWGGPLNTGRLRISTSDDEGSEYIEFGDYEAQNRGGPFTQWLKMNRTTFEWMGDPIWHEGNALSLLAGHPSVDIQEAHLGGAVDDGTNALQVAGGTRTDTLAAGTVQAPTESIETDGNVKVQGEGQMQLGDFAIQYNAATQSLDFNWIGA